MLINILKLSRELSELCGFINVPDIFQFIRFKKKFFKVKENNFNLFDTLFRNAKKLSKNNPKFSPHAFAFSNMPKQFLANKELKFSFMNDHYFYALKTASVTNGLSIIQHIDLYNKDAIKINQAKSAYEYKDEYDSKTLIPVLNYLLGNHPAF